MLQLANDLKWFVTGSAKTRRAIETTHANSGLSELIEQMMVSIWCGSARFAHADITRMDATLVRLIDLGQAVRHKAIVRLF